MLPALSPALSPVGDISSGLPLWHAAARVPNLAFEIIAATQLQTQLLCCKEGGRGCCTGTNWAQQKAEHKFTDPGKHLPHRRTVRACRSEAKAVGVQGVERKQLSLGHYVCWDVARGTPRGHAGEAAGECAGHGGGARHLRGAGHARIRAAAVRRHTVAA